MIRSKYERSAAATSCDFCLRSWDYRGSGSPGTRARTHRARGFSTGGRHSCGAPNSGAGACESIGNDPGRQSYADCFNRTVSSRNDTPNFLSSSITCFRRELQNIAGVFQTSTIFLKIWTGSYSFRWEAQIEHEFPEEVIVNPHFSMEIPQIRWNIPQIRWKSRKFDGNPAKLTRILRFLRQARDANQKWIIHNYISRKLIGNPSFLMRLPRNPSGTVHCS